MSATTSTMTMPANGRGRNFIGDLGVQVKIGLIVAIGVVVAVVIGTISLHALSASATAANNLYVNNVPSVKALGQVSTAMAQSRVDLAQQLISLDAAMTTKYADAFRNEVSVVESALADFRKSGPAAPDAQIAELEANWRKFADLGASTQLVNGERKDVKAWQTVRDQQLAPLFVEINKQLSDLTSVQAQAVSAAAEEISRSVEQTATTAEMSRSVSEAATGTNEISQNITGVAEAARLTTEGVQQSQQATGDLARMSAELTSLVSTFCY